MRFITEFESTYGGESQQRYIEKMPYWEERGAADMGTMIGKAFGWKQKEVLSETRHILEIEAFEVDKWIEFKKRLFNALPDYDVTSRIKIINAMAYLESHEKPVTNDQSKTGSQL